MELKLLDLFAGIGGFSYAAEKLVGGFKTIGFCELDAKCQDVLRKHWPATPIWTDIRYLKLNEGICDVITAGFPCQDLSVAGKGLGFSGDRSALFYEVMRVTREIRPRFVLLENVANLVSHKNGETFQEVLYQIAKAGYHAEWAVVPASDVGACHRRARTWIIAYASGKRCNQPEQALCPGRNPAERSTRSVTNSGCLDLQGCWSQRLCEQYSSSKQERTLWSHQGIQRLDPDWRSYLSEPVLRRGDDGLSNRVHRLKQLGNSIVPHVAAVPLMRIKEISSLPED